MAILCNRAALRVSAIGLAIIALSFFVNVNGQQCGVRSTNLGYLGPYIVGGQTSIRGAWPWQVLIYSVTNITTYGGILCGGTLLSDRWVLTAAQCVVNDNGFAVPAGRIIIKAGSTWNLDYMFEFFDDNTAITVADQSIIHPQFNHNTDRNDIALLHLSKPFQYSDYIRPVCLPSANVDLSQFKLCATTGFGVTNASVATSDPKQLQQVQVQIRPAASCSGFGTLYNNTIQMCVSTGLCYGDGGGPTICKDQSNVWTIVGIVSFGDKGCTIGVDTRVSAYVNWIREKTGISSGTGAQITTASTAAKVTTARKQ